MPLPFSKDINIKDIQYNDMPVIREIILQPKKFHKYFEVKFGDIVYEQDQIRNVMRLLIVPIITLEIEPTPDIFLSINLFHDNQYQYLLRFKKMNKKTKQDQITGWYAGVNVFNNPWSWNFPEDIRNDIKKSKKITNRDYKTLKEKFTYRLELSII